MSWLSAIPAVRWVEAVAAFAVVAFVTVIYVMDQDQIHSLKVQLATEKQGRTEDRTAYATAAVAAATDAATETERRVTAQARNDNEALERERAAHADADRAAVAATKLRDAAIARALAASRRVVSADPAAVGGGAAAPAPDMVLPDVLGRVDDTAGDLATALDVAHIRGQQCERDYDALGKTLKAGGALDVPPHGEPGQGDSMGGVPPRELVAGLHVGAGLEEPGGR